MNQLTNAKIINFSLVHIFEILPELRFKYMEFYLSDKVRQLPNNSLAFVNSALSSDRGEHWNLVLTDSLTRKRSIYLLISYKKSLGEWFHENNKKPKMCVDFTSSI